MNNALQDRNVLPSLIGSFWSRTLDRDQQQLVRDLTSMVETNIYRELDFTRQRTRNGVFSNREAKTIYVRPTDIVTFGPDMQERIATKYGADSVVLRHPFQAASIYQDSALTATENAYDILASETGQVLAYPLPGFNADAGSVALNELMQTRWLVAIDGSFQPLVIRGLKGDLVCGTDFVCANGVIHFFEDPNLLFDLPYIVITAYEEPARTLFQYTLKIDAEVVNVAPIISYFRVRQTAESFEKAIAAAAGLAVTPKEGQLLTILSTTAGKRYVFDSFALEVDYPHNPLEPGKMYEAFTVIGAGVRVHGGYRNSPDWYRKLDWSSGLPLDSITPFSGLVAPDRPALAQATTLITGDKYHVRFPLSGPSTTQDLFWSYVHAAEHRSGKYLCDALGIVGQTSKLVNPVDVFFSSALARNAIVVELRLPGPTHLKRALQFVENEKPVGAAVITRILS